MSSAYCVSRQARCDTHQGESSTSQPVVSFWRCIWKLPLPNKIKAFAWRACRNILPTKANLFSRKITQDDVCDECGTVVESTAHVLWHCAKAKEVWTAANIDLGSDVGEVRDFIDLVWYALNVKQWSV